MYEENQGRFFYPDVSETVPTGSESDSVRSSSSTSQSFQTNVIASSDESIQPHQNQSCHMSSNRNAIRVIGESVDEILQFLKIDNNLNSNKSGDNILIKVPLNLFDKLDLMIFGYLKKMYYENFKSSALWRKYYEYLYLSTRNVVEDDFAILRILGKGGFGLVKACKRCTTGKMFAVKKLNKKGIKYRKATALCLNERDVLAIIRSPFVVCLRYAFTTKTDLYLILDLMTGGDLGFHLSRKGRFSEIETKYYAARTLLGLAAMHDKNIAYRDLKPENILMDEEGYTKISDLGLACKVGKTGLSGTCGTRGYWAPEMIYRDGEGKRGRYSATVDWFSFGCCLFEFMYGCSPFRTEKAQRWGDTPRIEKADRDKAINISILEMEPDYDERIFNPLLTDLISKLLIKDGKKRLGSNGYKEIAAHPWFAGESQEAGSM